MAGEDGRVGMWRGVRGWFAANAAGGCGQGRGKMAASACGGVCGAGFPQMRFGGMLSMTGMAAASARGVRWEGVLLQMRPGDAAKGGERWPRRHAERRAGLVFRKCGFGDAVDGGDGGRVGMWRGVRGCFSANAAGGCGRGRGKMDASARGGVCGAVFPQMRLGGCGRGWGKVAASARGRACGAGFPQMRPGRGCRERMPGEDTDKMPGGGGRKQGTGAGDRSTEQGHGTGAGNRSRESEAGNRSREPERGKRGGVGFFKAVSGFFTILAGWNEIIIQTIWLKR